LKTPHVETVNGGVGRLLVVADAGEVMCAGTTAIKHQNKRFGPNRNVEFPDLPVEMLDHVTDYLRD